MADPKEILLHDFENGEPVFVSGIPPYTESEPVRYVLGDHYDRAVEALKALHEQDAEIKRLRELNDEMLAALKAIREETLGISPLVSRIRTLSQSAIAKAEPPE